MCSRDVKGPGTGSGSGMAAHRKGSRAEPNRSPRSHNKGVTAHRPMKSAQRNRNRVSSACGGCDGG